jgi:rRNA-processing protein FCF1
MMDALSHVSLDTIETVTTAVIDTSSLIFAQKADFVLPMTKTLKLVTPPGVNDELQGSLTQEHGVSNIDTMESSRDIYGVYTVDAQVVVAALQNKAPVISDDFKLLERASGQGLQVFTVRTILELMLFRGTIDLDAYLEYKRKLSDLIRYAVPLFLAAEELHWEIRKQVGLA